MLKQTFLDPESTVPATTIDTTRADWLTKLPKRDLLSHHELGTFNGQRYQTVTSKLRTSTDCGAPFSACS